MEDIIYLIVAPSKYHKNNFYLDNETRDSVFFHFNNVIKKSIKAFEVISGLPSSIPELQESWILYESLHYNKCQYNIQYIFDDTYKSCNEYIEKIKIGAIFILNDVDNKVINEIVTIANVPIIGNYNIEGIVKFDENTVINILKFQCSKVTCSEIWDKNHYNKSNMAAFFCKNTKYLKPSNIIINRIRGQYVNSLYNFKDGLMLDCENQNDAELKADTMILNNIKHILAEKYLVTLIGICNKSNYEEFNSVNKLDISELEIKNSVNDNNDYNKIIEKIIKNIENIKIKSDFVICIPSISAFRVNSQNEQLKKNKIPKKYLRFFYDFRGYYFSSENCQNWLNTDNNSRSEREELYTGIFRVLFNEFMTEIRVLDMMFVLYALGERNPYVRGRFVPTQELINLVNDIKRFNCNDNNIDKINEKFKKISILINDTLSKELWKLIVGSSNHLTVLSDLPMEWIEYNGVPITVFKSISRKPITPGNSLIQNSIVNRKCYLNKNEINILVINTLLQDDPLFIYGKNVEEYVSGMAHSLTIEYAEANNVDTFINLINDKKPNVLFYYGHGSHGSVNNQEMSVGELIIGKERISAIDLYEKIFRPYIFILAACETETIENSYLNVANLLLSLGTKVVVGTYFSIDGFVGLELTKSIFTYLSMAYHSSCNYVFSDIIQLFRREIYIKEPLYAVANLMTKKRRNFIHEEFVNEYYQKYLIYCNENISSETNFLLKRDDIYLDIFKENDEVIKIYEKLIRQNKILPVSKFLAILGESNNLFIVD